MTAPAYLIATGATPAVPPISGLVDAGYLTSDEVLDLDQVPGSLAVIGANAVGLEFGQLFAYLGAKVTFFDVFDRIAPFEEPEISTALAGVLLDQGTQIHAPSTISRVEREGDKRVVIATIGGDERRIAVDHILVATGRRPNTADLGADGAGITLDDRGSIVVNETLRTTNPAVFAAGDVTNAP